MCTAQLLTAAVPATARTSWLPFAGGITFRLAVLTYLCHPHCYMTICTKILLTIELSTGIRLRYLAKLSGIQQITFWYIPKLWLEKPNGTYTGLLC